MTDPYEPTARWLPDLAAAADASTIPLRLDQGLWRRVVGHIRDFTDGEQAGVLLVSGHPAAHPQSITGIDFVPVPDEYVIDRRHGLAYDGRFHLRVAERAIAGNYGAILVHAHPNTDPPLPSKTDRQRGMEFLRFMARRMPSAPHGLLVLGDTTVTGVVQTTAEVTVVDRVAAAGLQLDLLRANPVHAIVDVDDRQLLAIGEYGQQQLAAATIAVVGISGGGSHVAQQLIHAGVGTLIAIDHDIVDSTNLRRLVGAVADDVGRTAKPYVAVRLAQLVRPETTVVPVTAPFPSSDALRALRSADILIGCVDSWDVRDDLNTFALGERIPYIDIGAIVVPATHGTPTRVGGQIAVVLPGDACLRCRGLVTDARVAAARERRRGYGSGTPSPQVVSINGTLASEAVTTAIMLLAGASGIELHRRYKYPPGTLRVVDTRQRFGCPSCTAAGLAPTSPNVATAEGSTSASDGSRNVTHP